MVLHQQQSALSAQVLHWEHKNINPTSSGYNTSVISSFFKDKNTISRLLVRDPNSSLLYKGEEKLKLLKCSKSDDFVSEFI